MSVREINFYPLSERYCEGPERQGSFLFRVVHCLDPRLPPAKCLLSTIASEERLKQPRIRAVVSDDASMTATGPFEASFLAC